MAIRFNAVNTMLASGSLPGWNTFTMCGWSCRRAAGGDTVEVIGRFSDTPGSGGAFVLNYIGLGYLVCNGAFSSYTAFAIQPSTDEWFFWALRIAGSGTNEVSGFISRIGDATIEKQTCTLDGGVGFTPANLGCSMNGSSYWWNGDLAFLKVWNRVLTDAEVEQERWTNRPADPTTLRGWAPMLSNATRGEDYAQAGLSWTFSDTTAEAQAPISFGAPVLVSPFVATGAPPVGVPVFGGGLFNSRIVR